MTMIIIDVIYFVGMTVYLNVLDSGCKLYSCIINVTKILKVRKYFSHCLRLS
jgi:hypothetical protein